MTTTHGNTCMCIDCRSGRTSESASGRPPTLTTEGESGKEEERRINRQYSSPKKRANWATTLLVILGIITVISMASTVAEIRLLQRVQNTSTTAIAGTGPIPVPNVTAEGPGQQNHIPVSTPEPVAITDLESNDSRAAIIGVIYIAGFIVTGITFLVWLAKVSMNLAPLGTKKQEFNPKWALLWWFIPIAAILMPYLVVKEIWRESHPEGNESPMSLFIGPWWITWLISIWVANITISIFFNDEASIGELIMADMATVFSNGVSLISLVLVIIIVRGITSNQEKKHVKLAELQ